MSHFSKTHLVPSVSLHLASQGRSVHRKLCLGSCAGGASDTPSGATRVSGKRCLPWGSRSGVRLCRRLGARLRLPSYLLRGPVLAGRDHRSVALRFRLARSSEVLKRLSEVVGKHTNEIDRPALSCCSGTTVRTVCSLVVQSIRPDRHLPGFGLPSNSWTSLPLGVRRHGHNLN